MPTLYSDNWQIESVEAVFWDKDGTFINPDAYWGKLCELRIEKIISFFNLPQNMYDDVAYVIGYDVLNKKLIPNGPVAVLARNEVIDILLEYNVITEENLDKIIDSGKITIYEEGDEDNAEDAE